MPILILKPRKQDSEGRVHWHDRNHVDAALATIAAGKSHRDKPIWGAIAERIEDAAFEAGFGESRKDQPIRNGKGETVGYFLNLPEVHVELTNRQAHLLWEAMEKLPSEKFYAEGQIILLGTLHKMLREIAGQLGEKFLEEDGDLDPEKRRE